MFVIHLLAHCSARKVQGRLPGYVLPGYSGVSAPVKRRSLLMKTTTWHGWLALVIGLSAVCFSLNPATAEILFKADFETGDFSQFGGKTKNAKSGDIEVVTDIVHAGKFAGRFTIHDYNVFNARQLRV